MGEFSEYKHAMLNLVYAQQDYTRLLPFPLCIFNTIINNANDI